MFAEGYQAKRDRPPIAGGPPSVGLGGGIVRVVRGATSDYQTVPARMRSLRSRRAQLASCLLRQVDCIKGCQEHVGKHLLDRPPAPQSAATTSSRIAWHTSASWSANTCRLCSLISSPR